jgi:hypothetical protein
VFFYASIGYKEDIPLYMFILQLAFAFSFCFFLYVSYRFELNINALLVLIFLASFVLSFVLRQCFWEFTGTPFGPAVDSYQYNDIAIHGINKNLRDFAGYISTHHGGLNVDDYGFPLILYITYNIAGNENGGLFITLVFNSVATTLSSYYLYKLLFLLGLNCSKARYFSAAWGFFPFLAITAATGLKENFFCLFIILCFYYEYRFKMKKKLMHLLLAFLCVGVCYLFRSAVSVMMIISFFVLLIANPKNGKRLLNMMFLSCFIAVILLNTIMTYLFGLSFEFILKVTYYRFRHMSGNIFLNWTVMIISAFIGPLSNFNRSVQYGIMHNSGLLYKTFISYPLWVGVWHIVRTYNVKYYAIITYIVMGVIMLILAGVSLDMRYQITFFPLMLPILAYALQKYKGRNKILNYSYIILSVGLIILYNHR